MHFIQNLAALAGLITLATAQHTVKVVMSSNSNCADGTTIRVVEVAEEGFFQRCVSQPGVAGVIVTETNNSTGMICGVHSYSGSRCDDDKLSDHPNDHRYPAFPGDGCVYWAKRTNSIEIICQPEYP